MQAEQTQDQRERTWLRLAQYGETIVSRGEDVKWKIGDLACMVAKRWQRQTGTLMAFAVAIKLPRPRAIYEYHEVAEYFTKSARRGVFESCELLSWAHFRATYRYCKRNGKPLEEAIPMLYSANDNMLSVETYEEKLRKDPDGDWITMRRRIPLLICGYHNPEGSNHTDIIVRVSKVDGQAVMDLSTQLEFVPYLGLRWSEKKV